MFDPVNDFIAEDNELFTFTVSSSNSLDYVVGEPQNFQLSIYDDDGKNIYIYIYIYIIYNIYNILFRP